MGGDMASGTELASLKRAADIAVGDATYTDELLGALIDSTSVNGAALVVWREKAAGYAKLVSTSEGGSSRSMSDLHKHALDMVAIFQKAVASETTTDSDSLSGMAYTVPIERV